MIVTGANQTALVRALEIANERFDGNLIFRSLDQIGPTRNRFTLTVKDSRGPGSRVSPSTFHPTRRVKAACWHAHGIFFEELFKLRPDAVVRAVGRKITATEGNWQDWNVGSIMRPLLYSEACDCYQYQAGIFEGLIVATRSSA